MKYTVSIENEVCSVEIPDADSRTDGGEIQTILWNGKPVKVDGNLDRSSTSASLLIDDQPYEISWKDNGRMIGIQIGRAQYDVRVDRKGFGRSHARSGGKGHDEEIVTAPMPGMVVMVKVEADQDVHKGEPLLILEAMKMENQLRSPVDGRIRKVVVNKGQKVEKGAKLIIIGLLKV